MDNRHVRYMDLVCISHNTSKEVGKFLTMVRSLSAINTVWLVDNCSSEEELSLIQKDCEKHHVHLIQNDKNYGFDYANNVGLMASVEHGGSQFVCIANTDVIFTDEVVNYLFDEMEQYPDIGAIVPSMINANGTKVMSARNFPTYRRMLADCFFLLRRRFLKKHGTDYRRIERGKHEIIDAANAGFMMFRKEALVACGYFDSNIFMYYDEDALCNRLLDANFKTAYCPEPVVIHDHDFNKKGQIDIIKVSAASGRYYMKKYVHPAWPLYLLYALFNRTHILEMRIVSWVAKKKRQRKA